MPESKITINGQDFEAPKKGETLHVTGANKDGKTVVRISGVEGANISISGSGNSSLQHIRSPRPEASQAQFEIPVDVSLPPKVSIKEVYEICRWLTRNSRIPLWKKSTLEEDLAEIHPGLSAETIQNIYTFNQAQNGWPDWNELPN